MQATATTSESVPEAASFSSSSVSGEKPGKSSQECGMNAGKLAKILGGELLGNPEAEISGLAGIDNARAGDLTFIRTSKFASMWERSKASVAVLVREVAPPKVIGDNRAIIVVDDADTAQLKILAAMAPPKSPLEAGVDATAKVHPSAVVDPTAQIGPMCVVSARAKVGARAQLTANVFVGEEASVGTDSVMGPGASLMERCVVGNHCRIAGGVVIGADGFGYTMQSHPSGRGKYLVHFPHIGNVVVGDHVDIGSNTCIDRAKFGSTSIGSGTKIDNLVQIGHNCRIGKSCIICGQVGLSGSVTLGDGVQLAGRVGVADNLHIGAMARVGASAGVMNDIPAGQTWLGAPAMPVKEAARNMALFRRLSQILKKVKLDE